MSTGEGAEVTGDARDDHAAHDDRDRRGERIGIGGGDDSVTRIQLAARWAEAYGPATDSLGRILERFRAAYDYLDAVIHGVEPPELDEALMDTHTLPVRPTAPPLPPPPYSSVGAAEPAAPPPPPPGSEPRPWG